MLSVNPLGFAFFCWDPGCNACCEEFESIGLAAKGAIVGKARQTAPPVGSQRDGSSGDATEVTGVDGCALPGTIFTPLF
jgi:hypothetical protein